MHACPLYTTIFPKSLLVFTANERQHRQTNRNTRHSTIDKQKNYRPKRQKSKPNSRQTAPKTKKHVKRQPTQAYLDQTTEHPALWTLDSEAPPKTIHSQRPEEQIPSSGQINPKKTPSGGLYGISDKYSQINIVTECICKTHQSRPPLPPGGGRVPPHRSICSCELALESPSSRSRRMPSRQSWCCRSRGRVDTSRREACVHW